MEVNKLSLANQSYLNKPVSQETTPQEAPKEVKNGKKKMVAALAGLAILGATAVMIFKGRGKQASDILEESNEAITKNLSDIKFDKGIAKQGDELFSGVIEDTLKNGQKITLEYQNGIIQKATKDGIEKTFDHEASKKLADIAKEENDKLKDLIKNNSDISLEDFTKQTDEIKYKSNNDVKAIDNIKNQKQKILDEAKIKLENIKNEAQERIKKEAEIKRAQQNQDDLIEIMQNPSKKSAQESAEVFIEKFKFEDDIKKMSLDELRQTSRKYAFEDTEKYWECKRAEILRLYGVDIKKPVKHGVSKGASVVSGHHGFNGSNMQYRQAANLKLTEKEADICDDLYRALRKNDIEKYDKIAKEYPEIAKKFEKLDDFEQRVTRYTGMTSEINKRFEKLPALTEDHVAYRGRIRSTLESSWNADLDLIDKSKAGDTIVLDTAFPYFADNIETAHTHFAGSGKESYMYEAIFPKGAKVSCNLEHGGELIPPANSKFKILSKETLEDGSNFIKLEYILPET